MKVRERIKKLPRKTKIILVVFLVLAVLFCGYLIWDISSEGPLTRLFNDREVILEFIGRAGFWAPLAYVFLQILQTVIAPIPGGAIGPIGGFLFGWAGIAWTLIGTTIGAAIVFYISKKFGRDLAEKLLDKETFEKFDIIPEKKAEMMIFALFLIPGLPDDVISYVAGLTKVPIFRLTASWFFGRIPAVVVANMIGMGAQEGDLGMVAVFLGIAVVVIAIATFRGKEIIDFLKKRYADKETQA